MWRNYSGLQFRHGLYTNPEAGRVFRNATFLCVYDTQTLVESD